MAALPPGMPGPGGPPPGLPPSGPPGAPPMGPPPGAPPGAPPPNLAALLGGGPPPPTQASSTFPSAYSDLSTKMEPCYQLLDVAARTLKMAMDTGGFYKSPAVLAAVRHYESELMKIVSSYSDGSKKSKTLEAPASSSSPVTGISDEGDLDDGDTGEAEENSDAS